VFHQTTLESRSFLPESCGMVVFFIKLYAISKTYWFSFTHILLPHGLALKQDGKPANAFLVSYQRIADAPDPATMSCQVHGQEEENNETKIRKSNEPGNEREHVQGSYSAWPLSDPSRERP